MNKYIYIQIDRILSYTYNFQIKNVKSEYLECLQITRLFRAFTGERLAWKPYSNKQNTMEQEDDILSIFIGSARQCMLVDLRK